MFSRICNYIANLICIILLGMSVLFVSCKTDEYNEPIQTETNDKNGKNDTNKDNNDDDNISVGDNEGQNLLENGGLEEWIPLISYDMPVNWLAHNNYNVRKNRNVVFEGNYSAKMQSKETGSTATIDQRIPVKSGSSIRIRFHYYVEQWKDKGARTYCYFRTRAAEVSTIPADELKSFYDNKTYYIIRGGGYGLTYLPHELNVWQEFDETIEVPPTATYFVFGVNSYYGTTIYVDDCWVNESQDK